MEKEVEELTVEELQDKCRKSLTIKMEDVASIEKHLQGLKIKEYKVFPNGDVKIYDEIDIGAVVAYLHDKKVKILAIRSSDENVEDYYLNLIKEVR